MSETIYTLLGVREDGVSPVIQLTPATTRAQALREARSFLAEHRSCAAVEVWKDGALVQTVSPDGGAQRDRVGRDN